MSVPPAFLQAASACTTAYLPYRIILSLHYSLRDCTRNSSTRGGANKQSRTEQPRPVTAVLSPSSPKLLDLRNPKSRPPPLGVAVIYLSFLWVFFVRPACLSSSLSASFFAATSSVGLLRQRCMTSAYRLANSSLEFVTVSTLHLLNIYSTVL